MRRALHIMASALAAAVLLSGSAAAKDRDPTEVVGSQARQLLVKQALRMHYSGTLVAELNQNKKIYNSLNPQQLRDLRERVYAIRKMAPDHQVNIVNAMQEFLKLTTEQRREFRERQSWLRIVVASLTPAEREELKRLTPAERAKRLLALKARLLATQPATLPTQPAE